MHKPVREFKGVEELLQPLDRDSLPTQDIEMGTMGPTWKPQLVIELLQPLDKDHHPTQDIEMGTMDYLP